MFEELVRQELQKPTDLSGRRRTNERAEVAPTGCTTTVPWVRAATTSSRAMKVTTPFVAMTGTICWKDKPALIPWPAATTTTRSKVERTGTLVGNGGNDLLQGGDGSVALLDDGDDFLNGNGGNDTLSGERRSGSARHLVGGHNRSCPPTESRKERALGLLVRTLYSAAPASMGTI